MHNRDYIQKLVADHYAIFRAAGESVANSRKYAVAVVASICHYDHAVLIAEQWAATLSA